MAKRPRSNIREHMMATALDELAKYQEFKEGIYPFLRDCIEKGMTADEIQKHPKIQALLVARQLTIALKDQDSTKALGAIKDIRDRTEGKAKERVEHEHKYAKLKDEELDALLATELSSGGSERSEDTEH